MVDKVRTQPCGDLRCNRPQRKPGCHPSWAEALCIHLPGQDRRGNLGALPEARTAGSHASRFALASPCRAWLQSSGRWRSTPGIYDTPRGRAFAVASGGALCRCNSRLHLPPSTTFLPVFQLMGYAVLLFFAEILDFHGLQGYKCRYLTPKDTG